MVIPPGTKQSEKYPTTDEIRIYFGVSPDVWRHTMLRCGYGPAALLPPGEDFTQYKWPVTGRDVLMMQIGKYQEGVLQQFCEHLVIKGATIVRVIYDIGTGPLLSAFRPEVRHAA